MIPFSKWHGCGNDFIVLDRLSGDPFPTDLPFFAKYACHRHFGVGADGVLVVRRGGVAEFAMDIVNADGSEGDMCGNGLRCAARFLSLRGHFCGSDVHIETRSRVVRASLREELVDVDMGEYSISALALGLPPDVDPLEVEGGVAVSMGNPHLVLFRDGDVLREGPVIEHHPLFANRTNVHFVSSWSGDSATARTWERGTGATMACGTGACAIAVAGMLTGRMGSAAAVTLPGGTLNIRIEEDGRVAMLGPAVEVFQGYLP